MHHNTIRTALRGRRVVVLALVLVTLGMFLCPTVARADDDDHNSFFGNGLFGFSPFFGLGNGFGSFGGDSGAIVAIVFAVIQLVLAIINLSQGAH